jgi:hypothetical protein
MENFTQKLKKKRHCCLICKLNKKSALRTICSEGGQSVDKLAVFKDKA